jgi:hypothetical protein
MFTLSFLTDLTLSPQSIIAGILLLIGLAAIVASFVTGGGSDDSGSDQGPDDYPDGQ